MHHTGTPGTTDDPARPGAGDDARWVEAARSGDPDAFGRLFDRWFDPVYDVAWRIVRNRDTAAEVAQDVFLAAWQGLDGLEQPGSFGGWVRRIARNRALNRLDRERRSVPDDDAAVAALDRSAPDVDMTAALGEAEQSELVWAAASALGERDASLLDLHLRHGFGAREIADELGVTANNAHQLLHRLKGKLAGAVRAWVLWRGAGRRGCPELEQAIDGAGVSTFGAEAVRVIGRHADGCVACTERQQLRLAPEALFTAMPIMLAPPALKAQAAAALESAGVSMSGSTVTSGLGGPAGGPAGGGGPGSPASGGPASSGPAAGGGPREATDTAGTGDPSGGGPAEAVDPSGAEPTEAMEAVDGGAVGGDDAAASSPATDGAGGGAARSRSPFSRRPVLGALVVVALLAVVGFATVLRADPDGQEPGAVGVIDAESVADEPPPGTTGDAGTTATTRDATQAPPPTAPPPTAPPTPVPPVDDTAPRGGGTDPGTTRPTTTQPEAADPPVIGGFRLSVGGRCGTGQDLWSVPLVWSSVGADTAMLHSPDGTTAVEPSGSATRCAPPGGVFVLTVTGPGGDAEKKATVPGGDALATPTAPG